MQLAQNLYTWRDYLARPDEDRMELIDGDYYMAPAPHTFHQDALRELLTELTVYLRKNRVGKVLCAPADVILADKLVVQPDIFVLLSGNRNVEIRDGRVFGPPDLCVEILSESSASHDKLVKRDRYDRYGVAEYWIVDSAKHTIEVLRRNAGGALAFAILFEANDTLTTPLLPGFSLNVGGVFSDF